jgi:general secretion pathway protein D
MKIVTVLSVSLLMALPIAASAQDSSKISANAGDVDLADLIARFAKRTGKQVIIDPRVRAQVPMAGIDPGQLTQEQLLAILDVHQFAMVQSGGIYRVVPDANARQLPTPVFNDLNFKASDYEIVTLLVTPKNTCAMHLVPVLRPLMPQAAHLAAEVQTNTLIVNDRAVNARRIAGLVEQLDKRGKGAKDCMPASMGGTAPATPAKPAG